MPDGDLHMKRKAKKAFSITAAAVFLAAVLYLVWCVLLNDSVIWKNVQEIYQKAYPRLIDASSEEECLRLYDKMIADMEVEGLSKAEKVITENYKKRIRLWGEE